MFIISYMSFGYKWDKQHQCSHCHSSKWYTWINLEIKQQSVIRQSEHVMAEWHTTTLIYFHHKATLFSYFHSVFTIFIYQGHESQWLKIYTNISSVLFTRFLTFRWAASYLKLRSESSSDNSRDYTHSFWVASEQLTINPTLSQMTGFAHPSFTCNAETQTRTLSDDWTFREKIISELVIPNYSINFLLILQFNYFNMSIISIRVQFKQLFLNV